MNTIDLTIPAFLDRRTNRETAVNKTHLRAKYTVVESAGYIHENERMAGFNSAETAWRWVDRNYGKDEREELNVQVRKDFEDGTQTYDY